MSDWRRCSAWALSRMLAATTTSDHLYADCSELVEQLVTRLLPRRGIFANPDCMLTNSNSYGVTIAEHLIMVTLMLLRHASAYVLEAAAHRWGPVLPMASSGKWLILRIAVAGSVAISLRQN